MAITNYCAADVTFKVGPTSENLYEISDQTEMSMTIDNNVVEWINKTTGWKKYMQTAKAISFSCSAKVGTGDEGNEFVQTLAFKSGNDVKSFFEVTFPFGGSIKGECIISVSNLGGGANEDVCELIFEVKVNDKPVITEAPTPSPSPALLKTSK